MAAPGITKRHSRRCNAREGGRCNCRPSYQAWVYSKRDGGKIRKTFQREAEAKSWRADALREVERGGLRAAGPTTLREAWDEWHEGAKAGSIRNRSGDIFKPSAVRAYERAMRLRVLPELGASKLGQIGRADLQRFADELVADGLSPSTVQVTFLPLRAMFRRAIARGELAVDPCRGLQLPAVRGRRERFASPLEAGALIAAQPERDRPIWATAFYAGLRRGELMALTWGNVDLGAGLIRLEHGWDDQVGRIDLKTNAGRRRVPIPAVLRPYLLRLRLAREGNGLVFGESEAEPFLPRELSKRADAAWKAAKLNRITLHECRHTYASLMIAAGVNAKALSTYMGHANIAITLDRYGHLMPGSEAEAAELLDSYLERAPMAGGATQPRAKVSR